MFDALLGVGLVLLPTGFIALGVAMLGAPAFGKRVGGLSVTLGVIGIVAAAALLINPLSPIGFVVGVLTLIVFHLGLGWKVYGLSRAAPTSVEGDVPSPLNAAVHPPARR